MGDLLLTLVLPSRKADQEQIPRYALALFAAPFFKGGNPQAGRVSRRAPACRRPLCKRGQADAQRRTGDLLLTLVLPTRKADQEQIPRYALARFAAPFCKGGNRDTGLPGLP